MKALRLAPVFFMAIFLFASSASATGTHEESGEKTPAWIGVPPVDGDGISYFVASGTDPRGNESSAQDAATLDLISQINRYLGVSISTESTAEERVSASEYSAQITGLVKQVGGGEVSGMRIADRYVRHNGQGLTVYLLGAYRTMELEKEKAKRAALAQENEDAVSGPETKAANAEKLGQLFEALHWYLEAASAAANAKIRNADIKFERTIQSTLRIISRMELSKISGPARGLVRKPFDQDFILRLADTSSGTAISSADLSVSYKEYQETGKFRIKTVSLKTDSNGKAQFHLPDPFSVGSEKLNCSVDISAYTKAFDGLSGKQKDLVDSVLTAIAQKRVTYDYVVQANASSNTIAALVLELDASGQAVGETSVVQGIQQRLTAAGFKIAKLAVGANFLLGKSDQEVHLLLKDVVAGKAERLVMGTATIQDVDNRGADGVFVKVSANISVLDMKTGTVLLAINKLANERGTTKSQAISAAFGKLGQDIGDQLTRDLP